MGGPNEFHCENPGHLISDCPHRKSVSAQVNAVTDTHQEEPADRTENDRVSMQDFQVFRVDVMRALRRLGGRHKYWKEKTRARSEDDGSEDDR